MIVPDVVEGLVALPIEVVLGVLLAVEACEVLVLDDEVPPTSEACVAACSASWAASLIVTLSPVLLTIVELDCDDVPLEELLICTP
jgi:hypothetical protein